MAALPQHGLEPGAIYVGYEALRTPAKLALGDGKLSEATLRSNQSCFSTRDDHGQRKYRPCLILTRWDREQQMICAMGTFSGDARKHLADVYQHFIIPVYPNSAAEDGEFVIRTTIPWARESWIVGRAYTPQSRLKDRWCENGVPMRIEDGEAFRYVEDWCRTREIIWQKRMTNPNFARRKQDNYERCLITSRKRRQQERNVKRNDKPQKAFRSGLLCQTIPEDVEPAVKFLDDDFPPLISTTSMISRISVSSSPKPPVPKGVPVSNEKPNPVHHRDTDLQSTPSRIVLSLSKDNLSDSDNSSAERHPAHASTREANSGRQAKAQKPHRVTFTSGSTTSLALPRTIRLRTSVHSLRKKVSQVLFGSPRST